MYLKERINVLNSCKTTLHGNNHPGPEVNPCHEQKALAGPPLLAKEGKVIPLNISILNTILRLK